MTIDLTGEVRKMRVEHQSPVRYEMVLGEHAVVLNELLGATIRLSHSGKIRCVACGRDTRKSFNQGYCYPCFTRLAECDGCIVRPETCHYHAGTCRQPEWGEANCMRPHVVYLANSSGAKIGITRASQVPTRWIDQGAAAALPVYEVPDRRMSGLFEAAIKTEMNDRTDWRKMLRGDPDPIDLALIADDLHARFEARLEELHPQAAPALMRIANATTRVFEYPVLDYPTKVKSVGFDKTPEVEGTLLGVKGQYLILDTGVLNVRKHGGYEVRLRAA